jgi:serine protease Do
MATDGWALSGEREELARRLEAMTVLLRSPRGHGSGVRWLAGRRVITCSHVVGDDGVEVLLPGRERGYPGRLLRRDGDADLALLGLEDAVEGGDLDVRRDGVRAGELLFAMGNPWGEPDVLTSGICLVDARPDGLVHADLRVAPGNSGGPLVDAKGRLVGVISMYRGGAAVAIPASRAEALLAPNGSGLAV